MLERLETYRQAYEDLLSVPVIPGYKSDNERFAGTEKKNRNTKSRRTKGKEEKGDGEMRKKKKRMRKEKREGTPNVTEKRIVWWKKKTKNGKEKRGDKNQENYFLKRKKEISVIFLF